MESQRWKRPAARAALAILSLVSIPPLILLLDIPAALLAACGNYYSSCGGCTSGDTRPLCCIVVRDKFHPDAYKTCNSQGVECCGKDRDPQCGLPTGCTASRGIMAKDVVGTPTGDGTTGVCATPKYKSTSAETVTFFGFVRICPGMPGQSQLSWLCVAGHAKVYLDGSPHPFLPDCSPMGASNIYSSISQDYNATGPAVWRDGLCPVDIALASRLQDNKWHSLKVVYTNIASGGVAVHTPCCGTQRQENYQGLTLYLGCEIEVRDSGFRTPRLATPGKFQRVNLYGVPVAERSPTGEAESDSPETGFFIDVNNLAPTANFPEVSIPCEGGELSLEFRRDGGVRTAHTSTNTINLPITYPTDDLLGLGWNSNLAPRAIISRSGGCGNVDPPQVTITDSGGTVYQYLLETGNKFRPEVYDSQNNAAIRATPTLVGQTLTLQLNFGTKYVYTRVGTFYRQNTDTSNSEEYYRLTRIEDRNGNQILYYYATTNLGSPASQMLVSSIEELAHAQRKLTFTYSDYNGTGNQNGHDWGVRLRTVTDPLNSIQSRVIQYDYTMYDFGGINSPTEIPQHARQRWLLTRVTYPLVGDGELGQGTPKQHYEYELRVTKGPRINGQQATYDRILHVGLKEAWQREDASDKTVFTYVQPTQDPNTGELKLPEFPVAIHPVVLNGQIVMLSTETQEVLTLDRVTTRDTPTPTPEVPDPQPAVTRFLPGNRGFACDPQPNDPCSVAIFNAETQVIDPRGKLIEYEWTGVARAIGSVPNDPIDPDTLKPVYWNKTGWATAIRSLERFTKEPDGTIVGAVSFEYSDDLYGNLLTVIDMSGNRIKYLYSDLPSRRSNQPRERTLSKNIENPERSLTTMYEYGVFNKLSKITDPDGKVTTFNLDTKGNRFEVVNEAVSAGVGNRTTSYSYLGNGFIWSTTDAENRQTTFDPQFNVGQLLQYYTVTTAVDPGGLNLKTVKTYDVIGNLRKEVPPEGNILDGRDPEHYATTYEYDALNRLTRVTKPQVLYDPSPSPNDESSASTVEESFYDLKGNLVKKKTARAPNGSDIVSTEYAYDAMNRLKATTVVANASQTIIKRKRYDNMGFLFEDVDASDPLVSVRLTYDTLLRLRYKEDVKLINGNSVVLRREEYRYGVNSGSGAFAYNAGWNPVRVIDPRGYATDSAFDEFYRREQVVRRRADSPPDDSLPQDPSSPARGEQVINADLKPAEPQESTQYNGVSKVIRHEVVVSNDAAGDERQTTYTFYDDFDRATAVVLDMAPTEGSQYDPGNTRVNQWADLVTDPEDIVTMTLYDRTDKVIAVKDPEGNVNSKYYDGAGRPDLELGAAVELYWPATCQPQPGTLLRPAVRTTYDANGAVLKRRGPYGIAPNVTNPYDVTPSGKLVATSYDKQGRLEKTIVDLDGNGLASEAADITTHVRYDLVGNHIQEIDAGGYATVIRYDGANRKSEIQGPQVDGVYPITRFEYDRNSNTTAIVDPLGVTTSFGYDEFNRVVTERRAQGTGDELFTEKVYDDTGNLTELLVHNVGGNGWNQLTEYRYDAFGRMVSEVLPGSDYTFYDYYRDGKLKRSTDPNFQIVVYQYDLARRKIQSDNTGSNGDETRIFQYDHVGNIVLASDVNGASTYGYDDGYRLTSETMFAAGEPVSRIITSQYDLAGQRIKVTYPGSGRVLTQIYDPAGRLASITDCLAGITTGYQYDKRGNVTRIRWPDSDTAYVLQTVSQYDPLNRLESRLASKLNGGNLFSATNLSYDLAGNLRGITEDINGNVRTVSYVYDFQHRLTEESWSNTTYNYSYDSVGNRLTKTINSPQGHGNHVYTYDERNQLQEIDFTSNSGGSASETRFDYDQSGNLTSKELAVSGGATTSTIYRWDGSNRLKEVLTNGNTVFQATYDYRTRRLTATEAGSTKHYLYDGGLCIQERQSWGGSPSNELVNGLGLGGGIGGLLYEVRGGVRSHFVYNQVGHNVVQTDSAGGVAAWSQYEAFGNRLPASSTSVNNRLANTKEWDSSTELYNHGFRYYDPTIGRYLSRDPLGYKDRYNLYPYVDGNPTTRVDPRGLTFIDWLLTREWNPSPEMRAAAEQGVRESNVGGQFAFGVTKTAANAVGAAVDMGIAVAYTVANDEGIDATTMKQVAFGDLAKSQATQVERGEWSAAQGFEDSGKMFLAANPITGTAMAGWEVGQGVAEGDFVKVGEGAVALAGNAATVRTLTPGKTAAAKGGIQYGTAGDAFLTNASKAPEPAGMLDVAVHGSPTSVEIGANTVNHRVLAGLIERNPEFTGQPIRLLSCETGTLPNGFAQNLANKLGVPVHAPNSVIWAYPNGRLTIGPTPAANSGSFVPFLPGGGRP